MGDTMEKKVSIKDVAKLAGVSVSTVSRVLNNGSYVSLEKRQRIMSAVEELNFRPNYFAKTLKSGVSNIIALVVPNINNPVYAYITQGVESVARKKGYNVILCNTDDELDIEHKYVDMLKDRNVDGFIFATARSDVHHIDDLLDTNIPVVDVMRYSMGVNAVTVDNFKMGYDATAYLAKRGHKKIYVFTGNKKVTPFKLRMDGYQQAMEDNGLAFDKDYELSSDMEDIESLCSCAVAAIERHGVPDAIFCVNWLRAIGVYGAAKKLGLRIPEEISVFGVDDLMFTEFLNPSLTTISQPFHEMGEKAAEILIEEIAKKDHTAEMKSFMQIIMPTRIVERDSVAVKNS